MKLKLFLGLACSVLLAIPAWAGRTGTTPDINYSVNNQYEQAINFNFSYSVKGDTVRESIKIPANQQVEFEIQGVESIHINYSYHVSGKGPDSGNACHLSFALHGKKDHSFAQVTIDKQGKCAVRFK